MNGEKKHCACAERIMRNGHKIQDEFENPFSVLLLQLVDPLLPWAHAFGLTPNMVTSVSLCFGVASIWAVAERQPVLASLLFVASYFFDCFDGPLARKYNQVTHFGDLYDHLKDIAVIVGLVISTQMQFPIPPTVWCVLGTTLLGSAIHMGCVEQYNLLCCGIGDEANFLRVCTRMCQCFYTHSNLGELRQTLIYSRWFSDGTLVLCIAAYLMGALRAPLDPCGD